MGKSIECKPAKLASIVAHLQKSKVCWNIKDLEKQLPSVASINGMQVKDYLQALQDENQICVEKIGSGNWYWSFASTDKRKKQKALDEATTANDRISTVVEELRAKLKEHNAALDEGEEAEAQREELTAAKVVLDADLKSLQKELAAYSDNDPEELERKEKEIEEMRATVEHYTDQIWSMEGWFKKIDLQQMVSVFQVGLYGEEWDSEEFDFVHV